mgnify:CR=1 FL=1
MNHKNNKRSSFSGKIGFVLSAAGASVGLGNIWRFPFETGNHGGAAFILVYLVCVLILGIPIMIAEFLIGRRSRANTARAYQKMAPGTHWRWVGRMGVLAGFLILGYYSVVAGWTLEFIGEAATNSFAGKSAADFIASFNSFVSNPWRPVIWLVLFLLATIFSPLFLTIPSFATAPALIIVGFYMMGSAVKIDFNDPSEGIPAFLTILAMPTAYSISEGIAIGVISWTLINLVTGKAKEKKISPLMYVLTVLFILKYVFL